METLLLLLLILSILAYPVLCVEICDPFACNISTGPEVQFPFRLKTKQPERCGYPRFDLSCNNRSQTVIEFPSSGEFIVTHINYASQSIYINSNYCLPRRILTLGLSGTPFRSAYQLSYTFYNCTLSADGSGMPYLFPAIDCLGGEGYGVVALPVKSPFAGDIPDTCQNFSTVKVPVQEIVYDLEGFGFELVEDLQLTWGTPNCRSCEAKGGRCGFKRDSGLDVVCSNLPRSRGLPRSAKYGIIVGVGIPGLVCLIGLVCFTCGKIRAYGQRGQLDTELAAIATTPQLTSFATGLDKPTIESYPKTVLGESRRLPKHNDGTCPICLSDYQPKDTLRTIPECNHYFHANCIDEWLKLNGTCPVCRNTPGASSVVTPSGSSVVTPSSSISSSTTSS